MKLEYRIECKSSKNWENVIHIHFSTFSITRKAYVSTRTHVRGTKRIWNWCNFNNVRCFNCYSPHSLSRPCFYVVIIYIDNYEGYENEIWEDNLRGAKNIAKKSRGLNSQQLYFFYDNPKVSWIYPFRVRIPYASP